jgi:hypothetical protein
MRTWDTQRGLIIMCRVRDHQIFGSDTKKEFWLTLSTDVIPRYGDQGVLLGNSPDSFDIQNLTLKGSLGSKLHVTFIEML